MMAFPVQVGKRMLTTSATLHAAIKNVTIIGGGQMGAGIAQVAAQTGHQVVLVDVSDDLLKKSEGTIRKSLERIVKKQFANDPQNGQKFINDAISHITKMTDATSAVKEADIVIEAIVEKMDVKQKMFSQLDQAAPPKTIFASNTSSLSITEIARDTKRKDRFGGLHFFNPVPMMKLLEVVRIADTSDDTFNRMVEFGKNMGKVTVACKDTPGFIVNRLLLPYMNEAVKMLERGDATAKDIDTAMKLGAGYPMGPFELADYVGLDVHKFIIDGWTEKFPDNPFFKQSELINKLVSENKLGRKTGEGFYKYDT